MDFLTTLDIGVVVVACDDAVAAEPEIEVESDADETMVPDVRIKLEESGDVEDTAPVGVGGVLASDCIVLLLSTCCFDTILATGMFPAVTMLFACDCDEGENLF